MLSLLQSRARTPWSLCTIFSIIYFYLFTEVSKSRVLSEESTGLMGGFCVWGTPEYPTPDDGCVVPDSAPNNSHMYAWYEDFIMTVAIVALYFRSNRQGTIIYVAMGGIVFLHGFLHYWINTFVQCRTDDVAEWLEPIGWALYALFTFFLSLILFGIGFFDEIGLLWVGVASFAVSVVTVVMARGAGTDWLLSALFATSHPLASITGLLTKSSIFSNAVGWIFLVATLDGIIELTSCATFLKQYGGHVWYDLFLHISVIASLPIFADSSKKQKKR